jgi:AcrR family transcriptional regulator
LFKFKRVFNLRPYSISMTKKEQIIEEAIELFGNKGYDSTSIRELSQKAGINIAMINYYFGSKEKLFEAMVEHKAVYMKGKLEELLKNSQLTPLQKVNTLIEEYVTRIFSQPAYHRILYGEMLLNMRPDIHRSISAVFARNTTAFRSIIEEGIKKKVFRKVDPELTMASIIGTINQVMLSGPLCNMLINKEADYDPYSDDTFKKRVITHLQKMMKSHLTETAN